MKRTLLWLLCLIIISCSRQPSDIVLTFNVTNPVAGEVVLTCNTDILPLTLDENGQAETVIDSKDAAYAKIWHGRAFMNIYVERGDRATVSFDGTDMKSTFEFDGEKADAVRYLNEVTLTGLPDEDFALDFGQYCKKLDDKKADALKLLKARKLDRCGNFVKVEQGRIKYAFATPLLMYPVGHALMASDPEYRPDMKYYDTINALFEEEKCLTNVDEYRNFIIEAAHILDEDNRDVTDIKAKTAAQMQYITDRFKEPQVVSALIHYLAASYIDTFGIDEITEIENIYRTYVTDPDLLKDFETKYEKWNLSKPGKISPDFQATDIDGKEWSLADFRGSYVYIDMWATWCNPCRKEIPHLKALEEKMKDAAIKFVSLSTDGDRDKWAQFLREEQMSGVQLYIGPRSSFQKAYKINGIPRFILLDKEGRIISNDMSRPSAPETLTYLESLDGIR